MRKLFLATIALVLLTTSCNQGKIELSTGSVTLHKGEKYSLNATSKKTITYKSSDDYHAFVDNKGVITANFVGSTSVNLETDKDNKDVRVQVAPVSNLYDEPDFDFGMDVHSVIQKYGEPYQIEYDESSHTYMYAYVVDNVKAPLLVVFLVNGYVRGYGVYVDYDEMVELATFIDERYNYYMTNSGIKYYINALSIENCTMAVAKYLYMGEAIWVYEVIYAQNSGKSDFDGMVNMMSKSGGRLLKPIR